MVPPGLHLTLAGGSGNEATRIAEFHWITPSEVGLVGYMGLDTTFHSLTLWTILLHSQSTVQL
jgi:hypothetical protein